MLKRDYTTERLNIVMMLIFLSGVRDGYNRTYTARVFLSSPKSSLKYRLERQLSQICY